MLFNIIFFSSFPLNSFFSWKLLNLEYYLAKNWAIIKGIIESHFEHHLSKLKFTLKQFFWGERNISAYFRAISGKMRNCVKISTITNMVELNIEYTWKTHHLSQYSKCLTFTEIRTFKGEGVWFICLYFIFFKPNAGVDKFLPRGKGTQDKWPSRHAVLKGMFFKVQL